MFNKWGGIIFAVGIVLALAAGCSTASTNNNGGGTVAQDTTTTADSTARRSRRRSGRGASGSRRGRGENSIRLHRS